MRLLAALLLLVPALAAAAPPRAPETGLQPLATAVAAHVRELKVLDPGAVSVHVRPGASEELARALQTLVIRELLAAGFETVEPLSAPTPEAAEQEARRRGAVLLVRLLPRIEGAELVVTGDAVPTWVNFWAGRSLARAPGGAVLAQRTRLDAEAIALAHVPAASSAPSAPLRFVLTELRGLPAPVVAMAAGDVDGDGAPELAALTSSAVQVLRADGTELGARDHGLLPRASRPPREPAGAIAFGPFADDGTPRLAYHFLGRSTAELLSGWSPDALLGAAPLAAGAAGVVSGRPAPGRNHFEADVLLGRKQVTLPFAPVAVAAASRASPHAFVAVGPDGQGRLFSAELEPIGSALERLGSAVALADLDGDGTSELITSELSRGSDRVRVFRVEDGKPTQLFESAAVATPLMAAAAADLDGDGREEVVVAGWKADGTAVLYRLEAVP